MEISVPFDPDFDNAEAVSSRRLYSHHIIKMRPRCEPDCAQGDDLDAIIVAGNETPASVAGVVPTVQGKPE